jgi:hypothetical protein
VTEKSRGEMRVSACDARGHCEWLSFMLRWDIEWRKSVGRLMERKISLAV